MTTPVEAHFGWKWLVAAKNALTRVFAYSKQIAMLEARVSALEATLAKQPADACPFCGDRAMRKTQDALHWSGAKQWKQDVWTCQACKKTEIRVVHFS
jgi:hypothetical protein